MTTTGLPQQFYECLSRVMRNYQARFLEGKGRVISPTYSTGERLCAIQKEMRHQKLNINWNAEPNAPQPHLEVNGNDIRIEFFLNPFLFDHIKENDKGEIIFKDCYMYSYNSCNDEGYYLGQYRYNNDDLPWGEFYEIEHDWENDFHPESIILNYDMKKIGLRHFIFFFRDNTLECIAKDFEYNYLDRK